MAAGSWQVYGPAIRAMGNGQLDLEANPNIVMIFTSSTHVPNVDHEFATSLTNIVSGTNVPSAGVPVTPTTFTYNASTNTTTFDCADVNVSNATATGIRNCHIVDTSGGTAATNRLIAFATLDGDLSPNAGNLSITIDSTGVFSVAV